MRRVERAAGVFVLMCHLQRVGGEDDLPRRVLDVILNTARSEHGAEFMTLRPLIDQIESGQQTVLDCNTET